MTWFFQKKQDEGINYAKKLIEIEQKQGEFSILLKELRNDLDKLEIKALESRKIYHKKLKNLLGEEESSKEEEDMQQAKSINNPVILPYNGVNFRT